METLDFKSRLTFEEFPPTSTKEWEAVIEKDLKGKDFKEVLRWSSGEGIEPLPFYRRNELKELSHDPKPMSTSPGWYILESIDKTDLKSANEQALLALENGATGLRFDLPASLIRSKADLETLLNDIKIELVSFHFEGELSSLQIASWMNEIIIERKLDPKQQQVCFTFDPFVNALQTGKLASKSAIKDVIEKGDSVFRYSAVDASFYGNAGANIVQQVAFALASGNEYLGLDFNLADNIHFNFAVGPNYFLEIAKFRAFKLTWKKILEQYGAVGAERFLTSEVASWNKSKTDAHNNLLRATTEAMSAALGGCDAITVFRYDKHFAEPSGFASRIARNIQVILQEEAYLDKVNDPGAGSYYIEKLTDMIAEEAWSLFQEIERKGGFHAALKDGFIQQLISKSKQNKINRYLEKKETQVGVNKYPPETLEKAKFESPEVPVFDFGVQDFEDIEKTILFNIEAEIQKGDA